MGLEHKLICADWMDAIQVVGDDYYACAFADPPDNTGLKYDGYDDNLEPDDYFGLLSKWFRKLVQVAGVSWISYNSKWTAEVGAIVADIRRSTPGLQTKHCVQTFTFGQHNKYDLGNGYRPLWRLRWEDAEIYPDQIRVESKRQQIGDPRANPNGKVPLDTFDFPRVPGNAKQRRTWHKTQLHEGLIERCIKLSTAEGDRVLDPFGGTGTVLRVCRRIDRYSTTCEVSQEYCRLIAQENEMESVDVDSASSFLRCRSCRGRIVKLHDHYVSCEEDCGRITPLREQIPTYAISLSSS